MRLRQDERGQAIQVGAAILLGILVIAMTVYQVQIVPSENAEVEFNHNQDVRNDLVDLRNALVNAGTQGTSDAVGVTLGTQYPPRALFVNPSPSSGQLRTEALGNVSFGNVEVEGNYEGSANPRELIRENHTTAGLSYVPDYTELDGAGTTVVEHSLAYNRFESGASSALTRQRLLRGNSLTLTVLQGDLAEQATGTVSLDPSVVSGPTDPITITNNDTGPIELYLPTDTPDVWNETLGTADNAEVAEWDPDLGRILVELDPGRYELQMAMVGVGTGVEETGRYDVEDAGGSSGGAYAVEWTDPFGESANGGASLSDCGTESCTWNIGGEPDPTLELNATLEPPYGGIGLEFAVDDPSVANVSTLSGTTGNDGAATVDLEADREGTVNVLASANEGSDSISIEILNEDLIYNEDARADEPSYGTNGQNSLVSFSVTNQYEGDITITGFTYESSSGQNIEITNGESYPEVWIDTDSDGTDDGSYQGDVGQGDTVSLDTQPTVGVDDEAEIRLYHFARNYGWGSFPRAMDNEDLTVTLHYTDPDGNTDQTEIEMTNIPN